MRGRGSKSQVNLSSLINIFEKVGKRGWRQKAKLPLVHHMKDSNHESISFEFMVYNHFKFSTKGGVIEYGIKFSFDFFVNGRVSFYFKLYECESLLANFLGFLATFISIISGYN